MQDDPMRTARQSPLPFTVDPEIRSAATPPAAVYHEPAYFEHQKDTVFARSWHLVGDARELKTTGAVKPFTLLEGCLDEPLFLIRDEEQTLHCLSNVCTHRGNLLVEGKGHLPGTSIQCRYHGRRFGMDGCFLSMPAFDEADNFPSSEDDLPAAELETWGPFVFCALDPAMPFDDWIAPVRDRMDWMNLDALQFDAEGSHDYLIDANWALYCENYLEGLHIPFVHRNTLSDAVDYSNYTTEPFDYSSLQLGVGSSGEYTFDLPDDPPDADTEVAAYYFWLFPNLMLNFYPWGLSVNIVRPLGPTRTKVSFRYFVADESKRDEGAGAELDRVELEDEEIVEQVQRGMEARLYDRGRYSPTREVGSHHFHRLLQQFMFEEGTMSADASRSGA